MLEIDEKFLGLFLYYKQPVFFISSPLPFHPPIKSQTNFKSTTQWKAKHTKIKRKKKFQPTNKGCGKHMYTCLHLYILICSQTLLICILLF